MVRQGLEGNLYYTDTASIVTDIQIPDDLVDQKYIGKFKLEYSLCEGYLN